VNSNDELGSEVEASLASDQLERIDADAIEVAFGFADVAASAGAEITSEIPILRTLVAIVRTTKSVSTALLTRKVVRFLSQLQDVKAEEREAFLRKLEGPDRERIIGELVLVLERHETLRKSEIQGKLFAGLIKGELTNREYFDLTHATLAVNVQSLDALRKFYEGQTRWDVASAEAPYSFAFLQLVGIDNSALGTYGGGKPEVTQVHLGQKFVDIVFG
jgi:hypothetical protein